SIVVLVLLFFFFQAEDGIRDRNVTGVQTCALPICRPGPDFPLWLSARWQIRSGSAAGCRKPLRPRIRKAPMNRARGFAAKWRRRSEERRVGKEWRDRGTTQDGYKEWRTQSQDDARR